MDLTEKPDRKLVPLQFHHAFSKRFYLPENSPLRQEVEDLWNRREEESVRDLLSPFFYADDPPEIRIGFHNAVMRWKCSLLTDEQRQEHQEWIDAKFLEKAEEVNQPWKVNQEAAGSDVDELSAENNYIQRFVRVPPLSNILQANMCIQLH